MPDNIFAKAAHILMDGGHCKGLMYDDDDGSHCAIGALRAADSEMFDDARQAAEARLAERGELPGGKGTFHPLARWNDAPERTGEDVILLFKELGAER